MPLAVALAGGIVAWFGQSALARRTKSGSPKTAEAETLFEELGQLKDEFKAERDFYREENKMLRLKIAELEARLAVVERGMPKGC